MKRRIGFVSNSSSSSFIIGIKKGSSIKRVLEKYELEESHPFYEIVDATISVLIKESERITLADYIKIGCYENAQECAEDSDEGQAMVDMDKKGFNLYIGSCSDEGEGFEASLCEMEINVNTDDLIIIKRGGY